MQQALRLAPGNAAVQHDVGLALLDMRQPALALPHFETAARLNPTLGLAHFRIGIVRDMLGQPGAAAAYAAAIAATPALAEPYACLAALRELEGQTEIALGLYRQALARAQPGSIQALIYTARIAMLEDDLPAAQTALHAALARPGCPASARSMLANILVAQGDFPAARAQAEAALQANPREAGLFYTLQQMRDPAAPDDGLLPRMRDALALPLPPDPRIRLHLALARRLDQTGDTQGAIDQIEAAGALRARHFPFDPQALRAHTDRMIARFTPAYLARPDHQVSASPMPILVLGLPRSGTTLTAQCLARHPAIASAGEVSFWDPAAARLLPTLHPDRGADLTGLADAYRARLRQAGATASHVVDKNPFNFRAALLAHLALPRAKIIHCRRRQVDTALSIMMTALRPHRLFSTAPRDLALCLAEYRRLMTHTRAVLPAAVFHELDYETLAADPEQAIRVLLDFLELPFDAACLSPERDSAAVRTASAWQVRQPINARSVGRGAAYAGWLRDVCIEE